MLEKYIENAWELHDCENGRENSLKMLEKINDLEHARKKKNWENARKKMAWKMLKNSLKMLEKNGLVNARKKKLRKF